MTKPAKRARPLAPPSHMASEAAKIWRQVVTYLDRNGRLEAVDAGTIETYALAVVRQRELQREIDRTGVMVDGKPHAALRTIEATAATVKSAAHCLGLTPASRKALPAAKAPKVKSLWSDVLDK